MGRKYILKNLRGYTIVIGDNLDVRIKSQSGLSSDIGFRFANVFSTEEELSIEIANVDRVQINLERKFRRTMCQIVGKDTLVATRKYRQVLTRFVNVDEKLTISMYLNPDKTRFLRISQPMPPAPTTKTLLANIAFCNSLRKTPFILAAIFVTKLRHTAAVATYSSALNGVCLIILPEDRRATCINAGIYIDIQQRENIAKRDEPVAPGGEEEKRRYKMAAGVKNARTALRATRNNWKLNL